MNFQKRTIYLREEKQRETLLALVQNLPLDDARPLQITIEEYRPTRKLSQQAYLFAGPLRDIAEQAWIDGKQFSADVLHEFLKRELLPEEFDPEFCKDDYQKWRYDPKGNRILVGSTTGLTVKGFARYTEQVIAFGAALGVSFTERSEHGNA
jgi:hypothetical protein